MDKRNSFKLILEYANSIVDYISYNGEDLIKNNELAQRRFELEKKILSEMIKE